MFEALTHSGEHSLIHSFDWKTFEATPRVAHARRNDLLKFQEHIEWLVYNASSAQGILIINKELEIR